MRSFFGRYKYFLLTLTGVSAVILYLIYDALDPREVLPVYQPADFNPELVDPDISHIKKYHRVADFSLVNQNGDTITRKDYEGHIYIADFFFTTCPTICPIMTENMAYLQEELRDQPDILLLSHSVTPEIDSVPRLKEYALEKGVMDEKWNLVTGDKKQIYELARKSYMAVKTVGDGGPFDMIHTENFILVDKEGRIRGTYDGTKREDMARLLEELRILQDSYARSG
ncbi:SCO family protein [Robiginitalea sp. SC105]|uniref:SCO family protein n=1 Tax=Robiginitalea sp. SC105 TaxID=2762332 RepID=UPI00163A1CEA|nr:SCO family protein [Robiginitalea sp. SC105]MBC2838441.1 SCO family protein [Robiginitalea sp. SC105]